jgi:hypothetical protein
MMAAGAGSPAGAQEAFEVEAGFEEEATRVFAEQDVARYTDEQAYRGNWSLRLDGGEDKAITHHIREFESDSIEEVTVSIHMKTKGIAGRRIGAARHFWFLRERRWNCKTTRKMCCHSRSRRDKSRSYIR